MERKQSNGEIYWLSVTTYITWGNSVLVYGEIWRKIMWNWRKGIYPENKAPHHPNVASYPIIQGCSTLLLAHKTIVMIAFTCCNYCVSGTLVLDHIIRRHDNLCLGTSAPFYRRENWSPCPWLPCRAEIIVCMCLIPWFILDTLQSSKTRNLRVP